MNLKQYTALIITVAVLGAAAYFSQKVFISYSRPVSQSIEKASDVLAPQGTTSESSAPEKNATSPEIKPPEERIPSAQANSFTFTATDTSTVLHAMNTLAAEGPFTFSGREYPSLGFFVDSINGLPAQAGRKNAGGSYWFLYVNDESSNTGASQTTLKAGDTVEWRYQQSY